MVILQDSLQLAGFYVEGVLFFWVCLAVVFLAAVQQGLSSPVRKYASRDKVAAAKAGGLTPCTTPVSPYSVASLGLCTLEGWYDLSGGDNRGNRDTQQQGLN